MQGSCNVALGTLPQGEFKARPLFRSPFLPTVTFFDDFCRNQKLLITWTRSGQHLGAI